MGDKIRMSTASVLLLDPSAYVISLLGSYFVGAQELIFVMTLFVISDLITGIWKVIKYKGFRQITAQGIQRTIEKLFGYSMMIVLGLIFDKAIIEASWFSMMKIFTGLIVLAEFKSITENLTMITENRVFTTIFTQVNKLINQNKSKKE